MVLAPKKDLGKTGCSEPVWSEEAPSSHHRKRPEPTPQGAKVKAENGMNKTQGEKKNQQTFPTDKTILSQPRGSILGLKGHRNT